MYLHRPNHIIHINKYRKKWGFNLVKTKDNIKDARNHIIQYFRNGEKIVEMDDDIKDIVIMKPGKKNKRVRDLKKFLEESFPY